MKYLLILMVVFGFNTPHSYSKVEQHSDASLSDDLGFKLDVESDSIREVASDNNAEDTTDNEENDETQRDIASDADNSGTSIQFWKY